MTKKISKRFVGLIIVGVICVLFLLSLFIKIDQKIKGPARLAAQSEWFLSQPDLDKIITTTIHHDTEQIGQFSLFHFDRPDYVEFSIKQDLKPGEQVLAGDIVATLFSHEDQMRLAELSGQLMQSKARLLALQTGAKQTYQEEMSRALEYAKAELAAYKPVLQREKELHQKKLISDQQLEIVQSQYDLYEINVELQEARLLSARTGEKSEEVQIIRSQIETFSDQIELLNKKFNAARIKTPMSGTIVEADREKGELLHICSIDKMVAQIPVQESEIRYIKPGSKILLAISSSQNRIRECTVTNIDQQAQQINLKSMYMVTALIDNTDHTISPGMTALVEISAGNTTLWELLKRSWITFRFNK